MKRLGVVFLLTILSVSCKKDPGSSKTGSTDFTLAASDISCGKLTYNWNADSNACSAAISAPASYKRVDCSPDSFEQWLRYIPVHKQEDKTALYLPQINNPAAISIALYAEYLYSQNQHNINFHYTDQMLINFNSWATGFRPELINGKYVWKKTKINDYSYSNFQIFIAEISNRYSTKNLLKSSESITFADMRIGDFLLNPKSLGDFYLINDIAIQPVSKKKMLLLINSKKELSWHELGAKNELPDALKDTLPRRISMKQSIAIADTEY